MRRRYLQPQLENLSYWKLADHPGRMTVLLVVCGAVALLVFRLFPGVDLWATALFYAGAECGKGWCEPFPMVVMPLWDGAREIGLIIPRILIIVTIIWLVWSVFRPRRKNALALAKPLVATISGLLGPLLIVNLILKELWGRPRPYQTVTFGGDGFYVAPGAVSDQCASNCSFTSGEAAGAFWLIWLIFLVPVAWRKPALAGVVAYAMGVSILRVAFGRHYISDVTMSAFIATACVTGTIWALQSAPGRRMIDRLVDWSNGRLAP